jgi:hypothetical protein
LKGIADRLARLKLITIKLRDAQTEDGANMLCHVAFQVVDEIGKKLKIKNLPVLHDEDAAPGLVLCVGEACVHRALPAVPAVVEVVEKAPPEAVPLEYGKKKAATNRCSVPWCKVRTKYDRCWRHQK